MQQSDPTNTNTDLRALEIELIDRRNSLGSSHMDVAETLNIMGLTHHHMTHNQTEALRCHREALQILKMQRGGDIPDYYTALTQCDIGNIHWKMGNYLEAGIAYTEAMNLFERTKTKKANPGLQMASRGIVMLGIELTPEKTPQQEPNKLSRRLTTSDCQEDKTPKSHRSARERVDSTVLLPTKKRKLNRDSHSPKKKSQGVELVPGYYLTGHHLDDVKVVSGDLLGGLSHSSCPSLGCASNRVTKNPRDALVLVCVGSTVLLPTKKRKLDGDSPSPKKNNQNVVLLSGYLTRLEILKSKGHHQDVKVASGDLLAGLHHSSCPSLMGASKPVGANGA
eukprot:scaffold45438_cov59-Attheya_sp.AAC.1